MLLIKKSTVLTVPLISVFIFMFILCTDRNLKSLNVGLTELEATRNGLYKVNVRIVDIDSEQFTINDGNITLSVFGRLQDKKISNILTTGGQLWAEVQLKKSNGTYTLVSVNRLEDGLYVEDPSAIKDKVIINTKGVIGKFQ